jgi:5-amino-6-(5-phosphoribosylamino)uracil reductase
VSARPYVLLSCAVSLDGYLDDLTGTRLLLSNDADFDRVDGVRAHCDAILVGAGTIRRDDPSLSVRSPERRAARLARGVPVTPTKVTLTGTGVLDPAARFFTTDAVEAVVYCAGPSVRQARDRLGGVATVVDAGDPMGLPWVLADLAARGVGRLLVEGGGTVHHQFLTGDLADELQLVIAPLFVGDSRAPRFVADGHFPWRPGRRAELMQTRQIGDVVLLRYALSERASPGATVPRGAPPEPSGAP